MAIENSDLTADHNLSLLFWLIAGNPVVLPFKEAFSSTLAREKVKCRGGWRYKIHVPATNNLYAHNYRGPIQIIQT